MCEQTIQALTIVECCVFITLGIVSLFIAVSSTICYHSIKLATELMFIKKHIQHFS